MDRPFIFTGCFELREILGKRAEDEKELADLLEEIPLGSIYYHTHGYFLRHRFVTGVYPNDFATWAAIQVRDRVLGERLAIIDPFEFESLEALRDEIISVIDDHLSKMNIIPRVVYGEPFDFIQSHIVEVPTGIVAHNLKEFRDALFEVDVSTIYFHMVEVRVRLHKEEADFAHWLEEELGLPDLAIQFRRINPYVGGLERTRSKLLMLCDEALIKEEKGYGL